MRIVIGAYTPIVKYINGVEVEPILYNGTTYATVHALSERFGKSME